MDLKDLENLANKSTGLVPMEIIANNFSPYSKGSIHGFTPKTAYELIAKGQAKLLDAGMQSKVAARAAASPPANPAITTKSLPTGNENGPVVIEEGWREFAPVKKISLAKRIDPNFNPPDGVRPGDHAITVIEAELKRREPKQG